MALANPDVSSTQDRFTNAVLSILDVMFRDRFNLVREQKAVIARRDAARKARDEQIPFVVERLVKKNKPGTRRVDEWLCAVPLSTFATPRPGVVDDNPGCCPICLDSYFDFSLRDLPQMLSHYPVRLVHCGHIMGRQCLLTWLSQPQLDPDRAQCRECPICRAKLDIASMPGTPESFTLHMKQRRPTEMLNALRKKGDFSLGQCITFIMSTMNLELVVHEISQEANKQHRQDTYRLDNIKHCLAMEKWAWGFRGEALWHKIRGDWMGGGKFVGAKLPRPKHPGTRWKPEWEPEF